jgi:hypothetical protein
MHIGLRVPVILLAVVLALAGTSGTARAGSEVPEVGPQWMQRFSREVYSYEWILSNEGPNWARLADGGTVLLTHISIGYNDKAMLARRFAPDGAVLRTQVLPTSLTGVEDYSRTIVASDPLTGDVVVLVGPDPRDTSPQRCTLLRLDAELELRTATPLGVDSPFNKSCTELQLLADGSALAMYDNGLSRVGVDGVVQWSVRSGNNGHLFRGNDMLVDTSGVIWVASLGPLVGQQGAAVLRFDLDGVRLSEDYYLCGLCISTSADALDLLADGKVVAAGGSGTNQPGFFARYSADGARELVIDLEPDRSYERLAHDADGFVYGLARVGDELPDEVRRIDPANGSVLWTRPARDIVATEHGVVVTRGGDQYHISAVGLDASGALQWSHELVGEEGGIVSRGKRHAATTEFLVQTGEETPDCGIAPALISLDAFGNPEERVRPCIMPSSAGLYATDARVGLGVLASVGNRLVASTPEGEPRWNAYTCALCPDHFWREAEWTSDGGAWAIDYFRETGVTRVNRVDAAGQVVANVPFDAPSSSGYPYLMQSHDDQAMVVGATFQTLVWQGFRSNATVPDIREHTLPLNPFYVASAHALDDGGVSVTLETDPCDIMCPPPPPPNLSIARLDADGDLLWRVSVNGGVVDLHDDGGAVAIVHHDGGLWRLLDVSPAGEVTTGAALPDLPGSLIGVYGPHENRIVVAINAYSDGVVLWSLGLDGQLLATRSMEIGIRVIDDSPIGLLAAVNPRYAHAAHWIDPVSLETRATFRFTGQQTASESFAAAGDIWHLLTDGSVYGADSHRTEWDLFEPRLARFTAPGYTPTELIYRNGFD